MSRAAGGQFDQPVTLVLVDNFGEPISEPVTGWMRFIAASCAQLDWHFESQFPLVANRSSRLWGSPPPTPYIRGAVHAYVNDVLYAWHELPRSMEAGDSLTLPIQGGVLK